MATSTRHRSVSAQAPIAAGQPGGPTATTTPVSIPAVAAPAQELARRSVPTTTTTPTTVPPTTTTTSPPVATPAPTSVHYGQVTYYDHPAGRCASPYLSFGTVVRVTNPANGASVTCIVDDREADTARSIDLATVSFGQIAPLWQGVINAQLSW